jgi:phosphonate transport system substrate-binding protein
MRLLRAASRRIVIGLLPVVAMMAAVGVGTGAQAGAASQAGWPKTLVLGEVGEENATTLLQSFAPIDALIKKQLGITIQAYAGTSYAAMIEAQKAGKAQLVEYGPFSYVIALNQGLKLDNLALPIEEPHTNGGYYSEAVVNPANSPTITSLKQAAGTKVCFSDPASTSGYLYPSYGLLQVGISPTTGVTPVFSGTDSTTALDAYNGSCQIGFTNNLSLPTVFTANHVPKSGLKIIWKSSEIPASPLVASKSLPASLRQALSSLLIKEANAPYLVKHGYCSSVSQCESVTGEWGFAPPSLANYHQITTICKVTKSPSCTLS